MATKVRDPDDIQDVADEQAVTAPTTRAVTLHKVTSQYYLTHPFTHQVFHPGVSVEVEHLDGWIQSQIDAHLMQLG